MLKKTTACTSGPVAALANLEILEKEKLVDNAKVHPFKDQQLVSSEAKPYLNVFV